MSVYPSILYKFCSFIVPDLHFLFRFFLVKPEVLSGQLKNIVLQRVQGLIKGVLVVGCSLQKRQVEVCWRRSWSLPKPPHWLLSTLMWCRNLFALVIRWSVFSRGITVLRGRAGFFGLYLIEQ